MQKSFEAYFNSADFNVADFNAISAASQQVMQKSFEADFNSADFNAADFNVISAASDMLLRWWSYRYRPPQRSGLLAASLVLLIPSFFPSLFIPLGRTFPSIFSEWNAPQPKHLSLLKGALQHRTSIDKKSELWAPLAPQGWKPCIRPSSTSCKYCIAVRLHGQLRSLLFPCLIFLDGFVG
ncbi:hypothetical protein ZIOFF_054765 [Zingiber officinale]|uniref:Uncharacterized protein n=1 Tax=Zingiber officinale TaxID=94328 RepID=A0A8J5FFF1_ZINOF|nr:hypothetical protein ZIOFF_054765 [Zingiber officinale]